MVEQRSTPAASSERASFVGYTDLGASLLALMGADDQGDVARAAVHSPLGCGTSGGTLCAIVTMNGQLIVVDGGEIVASLRDAVCAALPLTAWHCDDDNEKFGRLLRKACFVSAAWSTAFELPPPQPGAPATVAALLVGGTRSGHLFAWRFEAARGRPLRLRAAATAPLELFAAPKRHAKFKFTPPISAAVFRPAAHASPTALAPPHSLVVGTGDGDVFELPLAQTALTVPFAVAPSELRPTESAPMATAATTAATAAAAAAKRHLVHEVLLREDVAAS